MKDLCELACHNDKIDLCFIQEIPALGNVSKVFPWNTFVSSAWDYFSNALLFFIRFRENNFLLNLNLHQTWNMIHVSTCSFLKDMSRFSKPPDDANMTRAGYPILQFLFLLQFYADNKNIIWQFIFQIGRAMSRIIINFGFKMYRFDHF